MAGGIVTNCGCFINGTVLPDQNLNVPFFTAGNPPKPDLQSIVQAIVQLQQAINTLGNRVSTPGRDGRNGNNGGGGGGFQSNNNNGQQQMKKDPQQQPLGFQQLTRETEKVKITNPNNPNQFVMVNQTTKLVMQDKKSGDLWTWELGSQGGD
jgi:hypothetical protein